MANVTVENAPGKDGRPAASARPAKAPDTIPQRLVQQAKLRPESPAYYAKVDGTWKGTSFREYANEVKQAAKSLIALGFQPGQCVCILGFNRPEWVILDVAAMAAGGAPAGIYTTCSKEEVQYIIHHAEAPLVLVENVDQWQKVKAERERLPHLKHVVLMQGAPKVEDPMVLSWEEFMAKGAAVTDSKYDERLQALEPKGLATLIYTSGTTGPPKGVMLSHENLAWTASCSRELVSTGPWDRTISYLPLSHIAEQMFTIHGPITSGGAVYFAESLAKLPDNIKEVRPTIFFGVPRIWEKFHGGVAAKLKDAKGAKKALVRWAMNIALTYHAARMAGHPAPRSVEAQYKLAKKLVFKKLHDALGLGSARVMVSGAAPIAKEVIEFFMKLDLPILEVYGQSEDTGPTSFNQPHKQRLGTVGPVIPGVEVKLAEDGEILVRGPNVFMGYYKEPAATAETLIDGWLHSGDLGAFDREGFLSITGRKKEIIITAGGKNIAPKNIESALKNHPLIGEAVVIGDRRKYLTCVISLDPEATAKLMQEKGYSGKPEEVPEIRASIQKAVDEVNATLARVETVKKFAILSRPFAMETGELTPTLKVKRKNVHKNFSREIEEMYAE
jgi:long-chain acyl-CoA synthetase